jgi:hypothetical protein
LRDLYLIERKNAPLFIGGIKHNIPKTNTNSAIPVNNLNINMTLFHKKIKKLQKKKKLSKKSRVQSAHPPSAETVAARPCPGQGAIPPRLPAGCGTAPPVGL